MAKFHDKDKIENIEEYWQKICYFKSGDGINYIHCCEMCRRTSEEPERILGGHYVCQLCKKNLKLPKKETIVKWSKLQQKWIKLFPNSESSPSDPTKRERQKTWKKLIKEDYIIEMFNVYSKK